MLMDELLTKIDKKLDKILNMQTKIAKALHLLPVTEKEERAIQIQQRKNLELAAKVNEDLNDMENIEDNSPPTLDNIYQNKEDIYSTILGDDFLGGRI